MSNQSESLDSLVREAQVLGHKRPVHLIVADALKRRIMFGGFSPGERLPTERQLAASLGVGRMTVRQAVRVLDEENLIISRRGRTGGRFVAEPETLSHAQLARAREDFESSLRTTLEFRVVLEPLAARLAAERATPAQRGELMKLAHEPSPTIEVFHSLDTRFHALICEATENHLIQATVEASRSEYFALGNTLWINVDLRRGRPFDKADDELFTLDHLPIAAAIADRDGRKAERAMAKHVRDGARHFHVLLEQLTAS